MTQSTSPQNAHLPLHARCTYGAGEDRIQLFVHCPQRQLAVDQEECLTCPRCVGLSRGPGPVGVLLCRASQPAPTPGVTTIGEIMSRDVFCVTEDLPLEDLAVVFLTHSISGAPVVDEGGRAVGVVSQSDLVRCWARRQEDLRVRDVMMPLVFSLGPATPAEHAAALMAAEGIHRLMVVDGEGQVLGVLAALDLVRWIGRGKASPPAP